MNFLVERIKTSGHEIGECHETESSLQLTEGES